MGDKVAAALKKDTMADQNLPPESVLYILADADPSRQKFLQWMTNRYTQGNFKIEDLPRVTTALQQFMAKKKGLEKKDINQYKSLSDLEDAVEDADEMQSKRQEKQKIKTEGADVIHKEAGYTIIKLKSKEAACYYGKGTKWCTAATSEQNMFNQYNSDGPLYVIIDNERNRKYQYHWQSDSFMNEKDEPVQLEVLGQQYPAMVKTIDLDNAEQCLQWASNVVRGAWPEGEDAIAKFPHTAYLYAIDTRKPFPKGEPAIAEREDYSLRYAEEVLQDRFPEAEKKYLHNPQWAMSYTQNVIGERFPPAEKHISQSVWTSINYAKRIVGGRFKEGEKAIVDSWNETAIFEYASEVIKGRWPEGERALLRRHDMADKYLKEIIGPGNDWPEWEERLLKELKSDWDFGMLHEYMVDYLGKFKQDRSTAYERMLLDNPKPRWMSMYITRALGGKRWKAGERVIAKIPNLATQYAGHVLERRWPAAEEGILNYKDKSKIGTLAFRYARFVIKGRWPEAEEYIKQDKDMWNNYKKFVKETK